MTPHAQRIVPSRNCAAARHWLWCLAASLVWNAGAEAQTWQVASDDGGIRVEARQVPGEPFDELRVSLWLQAAPEVVADYLVGKYLDEKNKHIRRRFIERGPELTIWSDVLSLPLINERCYSMRFERHSQPNGEIHVKFESTDYVGTKPAPDCIALRSSGEWIMTPVGSGTRLSYASLTDLGGKVPAALVRSSLTQAAVLNARKVAAGASGLPLPSGIGD